MLRFDKFTIKSQELIQQAQNLASENSHQGVDPEHLLTAILEQYIGRIGEDE